MNTTPLDYEKQAQFRAAIDGQPTEARRLALRMRADDIDTGRNESACPERMRTKVAAYLRTVAKDYP